MAYRLTKESLKSSLEELGLDTVGLSTIFRNYDLLPSEREKKRLFWRDDMENYATMKWLPGYAGNLLTYVNNPPSGVFEGDYVLQLLDPTSRSINAQVLFGRFPYSKSGFEIRWFNRNLSAIQFKIYSYTGTELLSARVSYHSYEPKGFFLLEKLGNEVLITGLEGEIRLNVWCYLKLIVDFGTRKYSKIITNETAIEGVDLSNYDLRVISSAIEKSTVIALEVLTSTPVGVPVYVDDARAYIYEE